MSFGRDIFFIREKELAEVFNIALRELEEIVSILESSSYSKIQIKEFVHFRYRNKALKIRLFSTEGALAIASELDLRGRVPETALKAVLVLVEQHRINQIDVGIRQTTYENCSSLAVRRQRHWLSFGDVFRIFKTTKPRLTEAFQSIQRSYDPLLIEEDFEYVGDDCYFSFSGLEKLSREFAKSLHSKQRREYCERVPLIAPPVLEYLSFAPSPSANEIKRAMTYAKARDKETCQITGVVRDKYDELVELVKHHLFDKNIYCFLASDPDNIITLSKQVSDEFHQWNGGYDKTCTIDDFIEYVELFYPKKNEVILMLYNRRNILQVKLSQLQHFLPESHR